MEEAPKCPPNRAPLSLLYELKKPSEPQRRSSQAEEQ